MSNLVINSDIVARINTLSSFPNKLRPNVEVKTLTLKFETWIRSKFLESQVKEVVYHNLSHTEYIVEKVAEIANYYNLQEQDKEDLFYAGWLHDVGYWDGQGSGHEQRGCEFSQNCLLDFGLPQERINRIKAGILATKLPQNPQNLFESILCDADLYHTGTAGFLAKTYLLKEELERLGNGPFSEVDWLKKSLLFIQNHRYHTDYAQVNLEPVKGLNCKIIQQKIEILEKDQSEEKHKKGKKEKKEKKKKPDRGVETLFRLTSANHMELSAMADNKANIMISVNSIIISIIITVLIRKLEEFPNFTIPAVLLLATCLTAMIFAILATRPKVSHGVITKEDIDNKKGNLLYFGNFHQMSLEDYTSGMQKMMLDSEYLYTSMTRDIYYLGKVLGKKYRLLRHSYNVFMFGFIISIFAFLIAGLFFEPQQY